ncbi:galactose oxidase/kelch repeat superfamily protein [Artemisia annua]|uniref:Galactose oxidase/kelch repeat superfamily protein n=1 Tax=Artemisia annua TaxID=35608 RepID=A0A2U1L093_ARTAN|nr:galactose oxidase/kelch repeat superfamily protein [Artemisia annua]
MVKMLSHQEQVQKLGDSEMKLVSIAKDGLVVSESSFEPLIPGLPDDIALSCLLRLPVEFHSGSRSVCRRWCNVFGDKGKFFRLRKEMGLIDQWLFVFCYDKCSGKVQWYVLDVVSFSWHIIPEMPCVEKVCGHGFRCVSFPRDGSVLVCGGSLEFVLKFDVCMNEWIKMKKMNTPRSFFASGVIDGMVYVAGGNGNDGFELNSGEVMDLRDGVWKPIASMGASMACYDAAVLDGKLYVTEGWFWPFYFVPRGQVYDPRTDKWECMASGLREGWTGSSVVMFGHLFVVSEHERTKLKVYDSRKDVWGTVKGSPLPEQICKPFVVNGCGDKIYVTGKNLNVAVGLIHRLNTTSNDKNLDFLVEWHVVEAPAGISDVTPSGAQVIFA